MPYQTADRHRPVLPLDLASVFIDGKARPAWIDAEVVLDRSLTTGSGLDVLQEVLLATAPVWCSKLRVWKSQRDQVAIDAQQPEALAKAVLAAASDRGPTYRALVEQHGRPPFERLFGSAELRGAGPELTVVVLIDEWITSPLGSKKYLGNQIALQVRRPKVEGYAGHAWLRETFETLCARLSPAWGSACHPAEYWAKVMSDGPRIEAVGRDFGRFLPGLFWLNFFGRRYRQLIGDERLRSTPAERVAVIKEGMLIALGSDPRRWNTPDYARAEKQVRDHLGPELFFSKTEPDRQTVAPSWDD
jgi:hypothetical protein